MHWPIGGNKERMTGSCPRRWSPAPPHAGAGSWHLRDTYTWRHPDKRKMPTVVTKFRHIDANNT